MVCLKQKFVRLSFSLSEVLETDLINSNVGFFSPVDLSLPHF